MKRPAVLAAVLIALAAAYAFATRGDKPTAATDPLADVKRQVIADAIAQYDIAKRNGNACAQASYVKAAVLQAHDEAGYARWSKVERGECGLTSP